MRDARVMWGARVRLRFHEGRGLGLVGWLVVCVGWDVVGLGVRVIGVSVGSGYVFSFAALYCLELRAANCELLLGISTRTLTETDVSVELWIVDCRYNC